jgi:hypothetical protein
MGITINPYLQMSTTGTFIIESSGKIVGTAEPDEATRNFLAGGYFDSAATGATGTLWGGVAIEEDIPTGYTGTPPSTPHVALGGKVKWAADYAHVTGFCVFDQNYSMVNTPQSPVPQSAPGMRAHFYRMGSGARVNLEIDPTLVSLQGGLINQPVSWDFVNQKIIAFATTPLPIKAIIGIYPNSKAPRYNSSTGFLTWNTTPAFAATCVL